MRKIRLRSASPRVKIGLFILLGVVLYLSASAGVSDIAGFSVVARRIDHVHWQWLLVTIGSITLGLVAYSFAWTGIVDVEDGPMLSRTERVTTAIVGFGGFLARGGSTVDRHLFRAHGLKRREINVRLLALDALEHAPLAVGCCALAIVQLVRGSVDPPPLDFVWPWAVLPPVGAAVAIFCTVRYRDRFRDESGFFRLCGIALDSFYMLSKMVTERRVRGVPYLTMTAYWCAELFALWSALVAFGFRMSMPNLIFAYVAAYVVTRRPAPFGGAGPLDLLLPLSLWWCGAPLGAAVAATIAFRFISLWLPFPIAIKWGSALAFLGKGGFPEPEAVRTPTS